MRDVTGVTAGLGFNTEARRHGGGSGSYKTQSTKHKMSEDVWIGHEGEHGPVFINTGAVHVVKVFDKSEASDTSASALVAEPRLDAGSSWQPIGTAPASGESVLVSDGAYVHDARYYGGDWCLMNTNKDWWIGVRFWMPMPPPPLTAD